MSRSTNGADGTQRALLERALARGEFGLLPIRFRAEVIDRYRASPEARLLRTRSVGRIAVPGGWSLDVGIAADGSEVEVFVQDLAERLPEAERAHWLDHLVAASANATWVRMRLTPAACIDDGEPEPW